MIISYDGTSFHGWQIQKRVRTIQGEVERALSTVLRRPIRLIGAGRTDRGVHAERQVTHFSHIEKISSLTHLLYSLCGLLPPDIRPLSCTPTSSSFHAQRSALGKEYRYVVWNGSSLPPWKRLYSWHYPHALSLAEMRKAIPHLTGKRDFASFAHHANRGAAGRNSMRNLHNIFLSQREEEIQFFFQGDGFLYKMVRNLMSTLLEIGRGKRSVDSLPELIAQRDRRLLSGTAPAHGLFLSRIFYEAIPLPGQ